MYLVPKKNQTMDFLILELMNLVKKGYAIVVKKRPPFKNMIKHHLAFSLHQGQSEHVGYIQIKVIIYK